MPLHPIRYHLNCTRFRAVVNPGYSARRAQMVTQAFTRTGTTRGSLSCRGRRHDELSAYVRTCYRVKRGPGSVQENVSRMSLLWYGCVGCARPYQSCAAKRRARASLFLAPHWALMGLVSITTAGADPVLDISRGGRCWFSFPSSSRNLCVALAPLRDSPSSYACPKPSIAPAPLSFCGPFFLL